MIFIAFIMAAGGASVFFVIVGVLPPGVNHADPFWAYATNAAIMVIFIASFAGMLTGIPFFILAIISEIQGAKRMLFHCAMGAVLGGGATLFWQLNGNQNQNENHLVLVGAAAGIIGASIYWLIAGRNAGKLFEKIIAERNQ